MDGKSTGTTSFLTSTETLLTLSCYKWLKCGKNNKMIVIPVVGPMKRETESSLANKTRVHELRVSP